MIKVIGLDLDNTLYPTSEEIDKRFNDALYEKMSFYLGIFTIEAKDIIHKGYRKFNSFSKTLSEEAKNRNITIPQDIFGEIIKEVDIVDLIKQNQELDNMLKRISLQKGLDMLTGSTKIVTEKKLDKIGINQQIFKYIFTREDGLKTNYGLFGEWIKIRNENPDNLLYVGDNKFQDVDVPKSFGIQTCFLSRNGENHKNANYTIKNIFELEDLALSL
ncbi:MAG: HAD hydrolase-like protein [Nanoarchaeota archaeon]|nr:HAD hydrolase-like protein [Nanoarchaeota archaeon]